MQRAIDTIVIYGATWCGSSMSAKGFFDRHRVRYRWVNVEENAEAAAFVEEVNGGMRITPTIVFPDGSILVEPDDGELAEKLGL
jgi:mycoredoxin